MLWVLSAQVTTFAVLAGYFLAHGNYRLGAAQLLIGVVQVVLYSGGL